LVEQIEQSLFFHSFARIFFLTYCDFVLDWIEQSLKREPIKQTTNWNANKAKWSYFYKVTWTVMGISQCFRTDVEARNGYVCCS